MAVVEVKKRMAHGATEVWDYISEWGGTSRWIPGVGPVTTVGQGVGAKRSAELAEETGFPGKITERLDSLDETNFTFTYSIQGDNPLPVVDYSAQMKVEADGDGSLIIWSSTWAPNGLSEKELKSAFEQLYSISLDNVEKELEKG